MMVKRDRFRGIPTHVTHGIHVTHNSSPSLTTLIYPNTARQTMTEAVTPTRSANKPASTA